MEDFTKIRSTLLEFCKNADTIAITTHQNPDGDGYIAAVGLQHMLQLQGIQSTILTDNDDLSRFAFVDSNASVEIWREEQHFELVIVLDCNSYDRVADRASLVKQAKDIVVIDHHVIENNKIRADLELIDSSFVSVGAIIYELFRGDLSQISVGDALHFANCIWTTILNDTNNFTNANSDSRVFQLASELVSLGVQPHILYKEFFMNHSANEMLYIGKTLSTIKLHCNERVLVMHSGIDMKEQCGVDADIIMNITRWVQGVADIDAIVYLREDLAGIWKVSLRSLKLDVQKIAAKFGGGGHKKAAGCTVCGSLEDVKRLILTEFDIQLTNPNHG